MNAFEIAHSLGKAKREGRGWRTECPVHHGHSLNLADGRGGKLLVKCWAGCSAGEIFAELRRLDLAGGGLSDREPKDEIDSGNRIARAHRLWDDARESPSIGRQLVERGITLKPPPSLRWATALKHPSGVWAPAMIAKVVNVDGEFVCIQRIYFGNLIPRKLSLGRLAGGAVRLAPLDTDRALIVGKGVESVLSLMQLRSLPGWAALGTSGLLALVLPPGVGRVLIAADHDRNGAGEAAARAAGARWLAEGRQVAMAMPARRGDDWNDVLRVGGRYG
jgi:hypothetical protein